MNKIIESIILTNSQDQTLRIYKVEGSCDDYCVGLDGSDHFVFKASEAKQIIEAIKEVVGGEWA